MTTVGQYIFKRLHQTGIAHVFGVPGDFNMPLLDEMLDSKTVEWVGTCNELNAAYAADGYARTNGTPAAVVTTYGVGEMSAINGISGSHCEHVPVLHIVGTPSREQIADAPFLHHAPAPTGLRKGDFLTYVRSSEPFSVASEVLHDLSKAEEQIDHAILECIRHKRPAYIFVPFDICSSAVPGRGLATPLTTPLAPPLEAPLIQRVASVIIKQLKEAKTSVIIADALALRFNLGEKLERLVEKSGAYAAVTLMGKGLFDETHPNFLGCYLGQESRPEVQAAVESAEFVLDVGPCHNDYNTGIYTRNLLPSKYVALSPLYLDILGERVEASVFLEVLEKVCGHFAGLGARAAPPPPPAVAAVPAPVPVSGTILPDDFLGLFSGGIQENDVVLVETGSFQPGSGEIRLRRGCQFISQVGYASIGYTLPAAVGAATARACGRGRGRTLLIEGDGSAQMTVQELSTALRHGLRLTVFLINNDGYLIERALHGPQQPYNDIPSWDWTALFSALGKGRECRTHRVEKVEEFRALLGDREFREAEYPQLVEVFLPKFEYPGALSTLARLNNERNTKLNAEYSARHDAGARD